MEVNTFIISPANLIFLCRQAMLQLLNNPLTKQHTSKKWSFHFWYKISLIFSIILHTCIHPMPTTIYAMANFVWNSLFLAAVISSLEERVLHSSESLVISCCRRSNSRSSSCLSAPGTSGGGMDRSLTFSWASERRVSVSDNLADFNSRSLASGRN